MNSAEKKVIETVLSKWEKKDKPQPAVKIIAKMIRDSYSDSSCSLDNVAASLCWVLSKTAKDIAKEIEEEDEKRLPIKPIK